MANDDWEERARSHIRELRVYAEEDDEESTVTNTYLVQGSLHVGRPPSERPPWERMPRWAKLAASAIAAAAGLAGAAKALWGACTR